jgi:hypothetical protein
MSPCNSFRKMTGFEVEGWSSILFRGKDLFVNKSVSFWVPSNLFYRLALPPPVRIHGVVLK